MFFFVNLGIPIIPGAKHAVLLTLLVGLERLSGQDRGTPSSAHDRCSTRGSNPSEELKLSLRRVLQRERKADREASVGGEVLNGHSTTLKPSVMGKDPHEVANALLVAYYALELRGVEEQDLVAVFERGAVSPHFQGWPAGPKGERWRDALFRGKK